MREPMNTEPGNSADSTRTVERPALALVLGSGGTAGGAFHAGVLKALHDVWNIDPRDAHTIIGTSAGALTGAIPPSLTAWSAPSSASAPPGCADRSAPARTE